MSSSDSPPGGGTSYERRQMWTWSSPNFLRAVSAGSGSQTMLSHRVPRATGSFPNPSNSPAIGGQESAGIRLTVVLVEAGQLAVVTLVQRLVLVDREALLANLLEDDVEGGVGALEDRGERDVKVGQAGRLEVLAAFERLAATLLGKRRVLPAVRYGRVSSRRASRWTLGSESPGIGKAGLTR